MVLFTSFHISKDLERNKEFEFVLYENIKNKSISEIILFCESIPILDLPRKVKIINVGKRLSFNEIIRFVNAHENIEVKIICNSDIFFDSSIKLAQLIKPQTVYCLTRWNFNNEKGLTFYSNFKSQDAWIFQGKLPENIGNYYMGLPGCDNRFAKELLDSGHKIYNPSLTIKAIHVHGSNLRNYHKVVDRVLGEYAYPLPVELKSHKTQWGQMKENDLRLKFLHRKWRNNLDGTSYSILERLMAKINSLYLKYFLC